jgi:hypothetical protein
MKAYLLKESLERLWTYRYEGAMLRYLQSWIDQLRWQRLEPVAAPGRSWANQGADGAPWNEAVDASLPMQRWA